MFSILGGKEIRDGCGIDAGNLSPRKRRDGSALVTFIPFGPGASVENPGCGVIQSGLEIIVGEYFLRISISSSQAYVIAYVRKRFGNSRASSEVPNQKIRFATARSSSE